MSFCVSCGTPVVPVAGDPGPSSPGPDSPDLLRSLLGDLRGSVRQSVDGLRGAFSGIGTDGIRGLPRRALGWFRGLSGIPKLVLVGLVILVLLVVLSPVVMVVAALLLVVSVVVLVVRAVQKKPVLKWGGAAVASVVMMLTFGGISGALYGVGFTGGLDVDYEVISEGVGTDGEGSYYNVVSTSNDLESLNLVAQEIQQERLQQSSGIIIFYKSRADVPNGDAVGTSSIYLDETEVRSSFSDIEGAPLSSDEVEQVVDLIAENGYVYTNVVPSGAGLPAMPKFMTEPINSSSASPTSTASSSASPSALSVGDEVDFTGEVFGMSETFNYDGRSVFGQVLDVDGTHIMVISDPMQGGEGMLLGFPGQQVRIHGEYQGTVNTSDGGSYDAVMAEEVEVVGE